MNPQKSLLYLKQTGHVLAAFTRNGEPDTADKTADLFAGGGLHLRGLGDPTKYSSLSDFNLQDFLIPPSEIAIYRTDAQDQDPVLRSPRGFFLKNPDSTPSLQTISNSSLTSPAPPPVPNPPITVSLQAAAQTDTGVLVFVEGQISVQTLPIATIAAQTKDLLLPLPVLSTGTYYALVFAVSYPICVVPFSVP